MKPRFLALLLLACPLLAQSEGSGSGQEDMIALSPFLVSNDADSLYRSAAITAPTQVTDPSSAGITPSSPITIVKRADALAVQFLLSNANEKQTVRNKELYTTIESLTKIVNATPGLRVEQREVRFASGERRLLSFSKSSATSSFASLVIFSEIPADTKLADRVKQIRDLLDKVVMEGETKMKDGVVGLYLKNPNQYRREILTRIFEDLEFVKKGLGAEYEVLPAGLNQRVQIRVCSEFELELWVQYGFSIRSMRELEALKHAKE